MTLNAIESWTKIIKNVGFPIAAFLLLFYSVREGAVWVGTKVVEPAVKSHVELVDSLQTAIKDQTAVQQKNAETNATTSESVKRISEVQKEQTSLLKEALNHKPNP